MVHSSHHSLICTKLKAIHAHRADWLYDWALGMHCYCMCVNSQPYSRVWSLLKAYSVLQKWWNLMSQHYQSICINGSWPSHVWTGGHAEVYEETMNTEVNAPGFLSWIISRADKDTGSGMTSSWKNITACWASHLYGWFSYWPQLWHNDLLALTAITYQFGAQTSNNVWKQCPISFSAWKAINTLAR